ncbi:MAG: lipopolysaccharide biosynthesis protein [Gemmatimonadales bacterium]
MKRLWRSPTLRSAGVYGAAGAGFAGANLILARVLPQAEYAVLTLVVALVNVGFGMAPLGVDGIVNRRHLEAGPRLLRKVLVATTLTAVTFTSIGLAFYDVSPPLAAMVFVSVLTGGAVVVVAAQFQAEQRFGLSLAFIQSTNVVLLLAALVTAVTGVREAWLALLISTIGWVVAAVWGWALLFRERHAKPHRSVDFPITESLSYAGVQATGLIHIQLERLIVPHFLPLHDLATFGVLAAIAGSLFRVLQMGVGYSLVPRLRAAESILERRRLVAHETRLVTAIVLVGSAGIALLTPLVERWFLQGKYHLAASLVLATVVSGVIKIINAFTRSTASALATPRELGMVNLLGWVSLAIGIGAGIVGARWGLAGVIYGVAIGWAIRAATASYIAARHLRLSEPEPVGQPATAP